MTFLTFFFTFVGHFDHLDPNPDSENESGSGPIDLIESGIETLDKIAQINLLFYFSLCLNWRPAYMLGLLYELHQLIHLLYHLFHRVELLRGA